MQPTAYAVGKSRRLSRAPKGRKKHFREIAAWAGGDLSIVDSRKPTR
jgi:hypothetical protein